MPQDYVQMATFVVMAGALYFILIRPQQMRQKQKMEMIGQLKVGDRIVTAGGVIGRIGRISEDQIVLTIANGVEVDIVKEAVSSKFEE